MLEVIISVMLISMVLLAIMTFSWDSAKTRDIASARAEQTQLARQVLDRISAELRGTLGVDQIGFPVAQRLTGDRRSIQFLTTALPSAAQYKILRQSDEIPPAQHDLKEVSYRLWIDPENQTEEGEPVVGGILRTEKKTLNQFIVEEDEPEQIRTDLWSYELGYLEFRYYDGVEWDVRWDITEGNSLPQLVAITVGFKPIVNDELEDNDLQQFPLDEYPYGDDMWRPDRYTAVVRIPAADRFFSSRFQRVGQQMSQQLGVEGLP